MIKQISRISPKQTAKVLAVLYFIVTIPFAILMTAVMMISPGQQDNSPVILFAFIAPFCYAIFGYLFTLIGAWLYNLVAKRVGGIEFTTTEIPHS